MGISTHILDTQRGRPADGIAVTLERRQDGGWAAVGSGESDTDGRVRGLFPEGQAPAPGEYRLRFAVAPYFARLGVAAFYASVEIAFLVAAGDQHLHVPLLLAPFGYSTYRGS